MDSARSPRRTSVLPLFGAAGLMLATACKPAGGADNPERDLRDWSLADIEAELARNDEVLSDAGIMVAAVSIPPVATPDEGGAPPPGNDAAEDGGDTVIGSEAEDPVEVYDYEDEEAPAMQSAPEPEPMSAPMDEPESVRSRGSSRRRRAERRSAKDRGHCNRVCDLAEATCDLEVQICEMAERHPDEPRYEQACLRAEQQCVAASRACLRCEE